MPAWEEQKIVAPVENTAKEGSTYLSSQGSTQPCGCDPGCGDGYLCEQHRSVKQPLPYSYQSVTVKLLPDDAVERKKYPIVTGVLDYFPDAIAEVAHVSWVGNQQHNPGQPLHWDRSKSTDQADTLGRHMLQRGTRDKDGTRHSAKVAWRALAQLQIEIEEERKALVSGKGSSTLAYEAGE